MKKKRIVFIVSIFAFTLVLFCFVFFKKDNIASTDKNVEINSSVVLYNANPSEWCKNYKNCKSFSLTNGSSSEEMYRFSPNNGSINISQKINNVSLKSTKDLRVEIGFYHSDFSLVQNKSILIYLGDGSKYYGPFYIEEYKLGDVYSRSLNTIFYQYDLISEKINISSNKISEIIIQPFGNEKSTNIFYAGYIRIKDYTSGYKSKAVTKVSNNEMNLRNKVVNAIYNMASIKWSLPSSISAIYGNLNYKARDPALKFVSGKTYYGIPYGWNNNSSIESFVSSVDKNKVYIGEVDKDMTSSNDRTEFLASVNLMFKTAHCATSVSESMLSNVPSKLTLTTASHWFNVGYDLKYIGNLKVYYTDKNGKKVEKKVDDYLSNKGKAKDTVPDVNRTTVDLVSKTVKNKETEKNPDGAYKNGEPYGYYDLYESYAYAKPGDAVFRDGSVDSNGKIVNGATHVRLVTGKAPHVVCRTDKNGKYPGENGFTSQVILAKNTNSYGVSSPTSCKSYGGIDPDKSYLILTDISSSIRDGDKLYNNNLSVCKILSTGATCSKSNEGKNGCGCFGLDKNGNLNGFTYKYVLSVKAKNKETRPLAFYLVTDPKLIVDWTPNKRYTDLTGLKDFDGKIGNWLISEIHPFSHLKNTSYVVMTLKQYTDKEIESPYAEISSQNKSITSVKTDGLLGTIKSNYNIKKIVYNLKYIENGKEKSEVIQDYVIYNTSGYNQKMYSLYYSLNLSVREKLNNKCKNTIFYDDVLINGNRVKKGFSLNNYLKDKIITSLEIFVVVGNEENTTDKGIRVLSLESKYTIEYKSNGGTGSMNGQTIKYGTKTKLTANTFTRAGYTFTGWNTKSDGKGANYSNSQQVLNLTSTDGAKITLYAQWKQNTYNITYALDGGTQAKSGVPTTYKGGIGGTVNGTPTKAGYSFNGWQLGTIKAFSHTIKTTDSGDKAFTALWCRNCATVSNGTCSLSSKIAGTCTYATKCNTGYTISNNGKYNPTCTANKYTIEYKPNGGTGTMKSQTMTYGTKTKLTANSFTRAGYTFTGWNTKSNGEGTKYSNKQEVSNITNTNNGKVTLYAMWKTNVELGDTNSDGKINYLDYVAIYNHIEKQKNPKSSKKSLTNDQIKIADMNGDGKINYLDYVRIYNKIKNNK